MTQRGSTQRKKTRQDKVNAGNELIIKDKFKQEREQKVVDIKPLTPNQAKAIEYLKTKQVVILRNTFGSGKSYLACTHAANEYLRGKCKKIVLIRPYEMVGRSVGLRPGSGNEKMRPIAQSMLQYLEKVFGKNDLELKIETGVVILECLEDIRGRSYDDSIVIVDEASNMDRHAMQAVITRLNSNSRLYLCGDNLQRDTKVPSGMDELCEVIQKVRDERPSYLNDKDIQCAFNNFGIVNFTIDDVVRSDLTALMAKVINFDWKPHAK
jgi:phosphate starvation-inducible protein PhoH